MTLAATATNWLPDHTMDCGVKAIVALVQVNPSLELSKAVVVAAINLEPVHSTSDMYVVTPEVRGVQVTASVDVKIVPASPTTTKMLPLLAEADRYLMVPDVREFQLTPSVDVEIPPALFKATAKGPMVVPDGA